MIWLGVSLLAVAVAARAVSVAFNGFLVPVGAMILGAAPLFRDSELAEQEAEE